MHASRAAHCIVGLLSNTHSLRLLIECTGHVLASFADNCKNCCSRTLRVIVSFVDALDACISCGTLFPRVALEYSFSSLCLLSALNTFLYRLPPIARTISSRTLRAIVGSFGALDACIACETLYRCVVSMCFREHYSLRLFVECTRYVIASSAVHWKNF